MILRKLEQSEHQKTRKLWEEVFTEDTKAFLDYYYYIKTRDNQIYVAEENGSICSMLQMNPYRVRIEQREFDSAYVVAVATSEPYRRRGYMGMLLRRSLEEMYIRRLPFVFLMPAAAAIYTPYDFRYIYAQNVGELTVSEKDGRVRWKKELSGNDPVSEKIECSDAAVWDADEIADFFNEYFSAGYQVCTVRDAGYYRTMILEQQSEKGGIRLVRKAGQLKGFYCYAGEGMLEIREPLFLDGYEGDFLKSVEELCMKMGVGHDEKKTVTVYACPSDHATEKRPVIMARVVCLEELFSAIRVSAETEVNCSFAVIDPILVKNSRVWRVTSKLGEEEIHLIETEDSEGVLPVADLTDLLFGYADLTEIRKREGVVMSARLEEEFTKLKKLTGTFVNEIV